MIKATLTLVVCLALSECFAPSIRAAPFTGTTGQAEQLLKLSQDQNKHDHRLAIQTAQRALALYESANNLEGIATARSPQEALVQHLGATKRPLASNGNGKGIYN